MPARPGPVVRLASTQPAPHDIDAILDDLLGEDDGRGPGPADAVLVGGGLGAVMAAQLAGWPPLVTVLGVGAAVLGSVLPLRAVARRVSGHRGRARLHRRIEQGHLLRVDHPAVERLLDGYGRALAAVDPVGEPARTRALAIAHAALVEVATLLDGRSPAAAEELRYVDDRATALHDLATTLSDPRVGDAERHRALAQAREEVERIAGTSSVLDAQALARDLLGTDDR